MRPMLPDAPIAEIAQIAEEIRNRYGFIPISNFTRLEVIQSIRFEGWRSKNDRNKGLPLQRVEQSLNLFLAQLGTDFKLVSIDWDKVFARAELITRSTPQEGWRTLDIIHVAAALVSDADTFYSYDRDQNLMASAEGLTTPLLKISSP